MGNLLNPGGDGDLERLLNALQLTAAPAVHTQGDAITLGEGTAVKAFDGLRVVERLAGLFEPEHGWGPAAKTP